jgi:hypothetical protein
MFTRVVKTEKKRDPNRPGRLDIRVLLESLNPGQPCRVLSSMIRKTIRVEFRHQPSCDDV